ncbi:ATP-binding cassette domain-containing protein [Pseudonocardia lutea]|uniref:ATP-binding cassette domain-containing protein n=1 Tax=Pseudonocardia lutea TaxID=2172015 RepID=A0ABW1IDF9_9PSEU
MSEHARVGPVSRAAAALLAGGRASLASGAVLAVVLIVAIPLLVPNNYRLYAFVNGAVQLIAVLGLNVLVGHAGLISLGTAAFAMVGAYTVALTHAHWDWPFAAGSALAVVVCAVVGLVTGMPALKLGPFAVAAISLAYLSVATSLLLLWSGLTGGGDGLPVRASDLDLNLLWTLLAGLAAVLYVLARNVIRSPLGRAMRVARLSRPLAESLGVAPARVRLTAFVLASALAGLSGSFYPMINGRTTPEPFSIALSVLVLLMVILGGEGRISGPLLGVVAMVLIPIGLSTVFAEGGQASTLTYGVILLLTVLLVPRGLAGLIRGLLERLARPVTRQASPEPAATLELEVRSEPVGLRVSGLAKSIGGVRALVDASLDAAPGTVHGLIGPNGSGKTTFLNCVSGALRPDTGTVELGGTPLTGAAFRRVRAGLSRTFQAPQLMVDETALENVVHGADVHRRASHLAYVFRLPSARAEARARRVEARAWLDTVGVGHLADERAGGLPAGAQRLVEIARVLATEPRIVLLDEPAAGLSGPETDELAAVVRRVRAAGVTVVIVEHDVDLIMALCDRVTVLDRGSVIAEGTPAEVRRDPAVVAAYLGGEPAVPGAGS